MRKFLIPLIAIPLVGCFEQQETQLAKCELEAQSSGIELVSEAGAQRMTLCMRAAGYERDAGPMMCQSLPGKPTWIGAACYAPADPLSKWFWQLELRFRFGEKAQ
jgi:hypothetical protein